jgi:hypothetical protein
MSGFIKFRRLLMFLMLAITLSLFIYIDYSDLSFNNNRTEYISIVSGFLLSFTMILANKSEKKENNT